MVVCPSLGKRKDEVVIMTNGDKFTGEIKGVQYGELMFKSDYMMKDSVHSTDTGCSRLLVERTVMRAIFRNLELSQSSTMPKPWQVGWTF
jgi:hypothetical protein